MNIEIFNILTLILLSFFPTDNIVLNENLIDIPNPINLIDNLVQTDNNLFDVRRRGGSFGGSKSYSGFSKPKKKKSFDLDDTIEDTLEGDDDDDDEFNILPIFLIILFMLFIIYTFSRTKKSSNG
jgi:hypothetical protein